MEIVCKTDVGNTRIVNQDYTICYKKSEDEAMAVLCDGMGGHQAGEVASRQVCEHMIERFKVMPEMNDDASIESFIKEAINYCDAILIQAGYKDSKLAGMGTTIVVAYLKGNDLYILHVGDSRAYLFDGSLKLLTKDHTLVNALVQSGNLSEEEAVNHPKRNILTQAVGGGSVLNISYLKTSMDDKTLLLCSDGLYNSLSDEVIEDILGKSGSLENTADHLIVKSNLYGGLDNIGVILMKGGKVSG